MKRQNLALSLLSILLFFALTQTKERKVNNFHKKQKEMRSLKNNAAPIDLEKLLYATTIKEFEDEKDENIDPVLDDLEETDAENWGHIVQMASYVVQIKDERADLAKAKNIRAYRKRVKDVLEIAKNFSKHKKLLDIFYLEPNQEAAFTKAENLFAFEIKQFFNELWKKLQAALKKRKSKDEFEKLSKILKKGMRNKKIIRPIRNLTRLLHDKLQEQMDEIFDAMSMRAGLD